MVEGALFNSRANAAIANTGVAGTVFFAWGFEHNGTRMLFIGTQAFGVAVPIVAGAAAVTGNSTPSLDIRAGNLITLRQINGSW